MGRQRLSFVLGVLLAAAWFVWSVSAGQAQSPYSPISPPLSPWMNLETKQGGAVDNYHMYVQPRVQVQNTLQQQSADIEQQSTDTLALRHYMSQIELVQHGPVAPTGTGSVFMQYSHYFPNGRALGGSSVIIHHTSMMAMPSLPGMSTLPGMTPPPGATPVMSGNRF